ncbi:DNA-binding protein [Candidatus Hecatella orcuttiae]|jgi:DNA-binding TFAR19-related protein (PDSD5 family)|uniref:DNA-binding protein n=1 Tax=Candidatus Hecatella orcuttiae TaxID=1935119 RepID=UPI00286839CF|nr:DNA-binding protein [Candidatus Hecatella orcuttiae]
MAEADAELERLKLRKLKELRAKVEASEEKPSPPKETVEPTPLQIVMGRLTGRGRELLETAYQQYPDITEEVVENLALQIKNGRLRGPVTAGMIMQIFNLLRMPLRPKTRLVFKKHGEAKTLAELLREKLG